MSTYEQLREANIARNQLKMKELGLPSEAPKLGNKAAADPARKSRKRRRAVPAEGTRRSLRASSLPPVTYTPETVDASYRC